EQVQQAADEATFARRALAVEKERAIAENELATQIELARRAEQLVEQEGANDRRRAAERAAAARIEFAAEAERIAAVDGERVRQEQARVAVYGEHGAAAVLALVLRDALGQLPEIGQLNLTPDLLSSAVARLVAPPERDGREG